MENYTGAYAARRLDVEALLNADPKRSTLAMHVGGIAVECQIKSLLLSYHGIGAWSEQGRRPKDTFFGKPVERPGHHLLSALKMMARLHEKAKADPLFISHLDQVMHPAGNRDSDFIALRYVAHDSEDDSSDRWLKSLNYVIGWLRKNEVTSK